ncbi:MAG TPA: TolC family protein, partial [Caulobacteraceae bacterium]|nr:TolC family protein [Caulobacteraceae bacterium]
AEARAAERAAEAGVDEARAKVRDAVVGAWQDLAVAHSLSAAAEDQSKAAAEALYSVRQEVRVGQKPTLDLLNAERESLAAESGLVAARGGEVAAAYRLNALLRGE